MKFFRKFMVFMLVFLMLFSHFVMFDMIGTVEAIGQHEASDGTTIGVIQAFYHGEDSSIFNLVLHPNEDSSPLLLNYVGDTTNYKCVDEETHDSDTTYLWTSTTGSSLRDQYKLENSTNENGDIHNVTVYVYIKRTISAGGRFWLMLSSNGTKDETNEIDITSTSYTLYSNQWNNDPDTGTSWTWDAIEDLEARIKIQPGLNDRQARCTQMYIIVRHNGSYNSAEDGESFTIYRDVGTQSEINNFSFTPSMNYSKNVTFKIPVSNSVKGILNVTNNAVGIDANEVNSSNELVNNSFYYDSGDKFVYIRTDSLTTSTNVDWTINCTYGATFSLHIPRYLEAGDYFMSMGLIKDSNGNPISGLIAKTRVIDSEGNDALDPAPEWNCTNGNYYCTFSTSTLVPGVYTINIEFTDSSSGITFEEGNTLYISTTPDDNIYTTAYLNFGFYNNDTGMGINQESFKIYVSDDSVVNDDDRIYNSQFKGYTGQTVYYKVLDYFNNQIYPLSGSYDTFVIVDVYDYVDVPIDWHSFSVKNMNHSIIRFNMTNGSRTYSQFLFPYEPFYWNVLTGDYTINLTYYNTETDAIENYAEESISITGDTYYWIRGYDLQDIVIEITNTNTTIMDQIINIGVTINNDGSNIINQILNTSIALSNIETNITNQVNLIWSSVNNTKTTVINQVNSVWQSVNNTESEIGVQANSVRQSIVNTETNMTAQLNDVWQSVNNTETKVENQANLVKQDIYNFHNNITTQVNGVWQDINNSNSTVHTQLNNIVQNIANLNSNITTQVSYIRQDVTNTESNITTQLNSVWQTINNTDSSITTQINSLSQSLTNTETNISTQITTVRTDITNFESNITTQVNAVTLSVTNSETNIKNQINLVWTKINNTNTGITTQINSVQSQVTNFETNITTQLNNVKVNIANHDTNLTNQINNVQLDITNTNTTIHNQLNSIITDITNTNSTVVEQANLIMSTITNTETNITNQLNSIQSDITNSETNIIDQVNLVWTEINNTDSSISTQINGISASITNTETNITSQLNNIQLSITNTETNITNQINSVNINITNTNTSIHNQINALTTTINNNKGDIINQVNLIWNEINNTETDIITQINGVNTQITTMHSNINNSFTYVIANVSYVETNITNLIDDVNATLLAKLVGVLDNVSNAGVSVFDQVTEVLTNLTQVNTSLFSELQSQALDIMINITEQTDINLNELYNLSLTIGSLVGDNLSSMITNITQDIQTIISDVGNITGNISYNITANLSGILENISKVMENLNMTNVTIGDLINVSIENLTGVTLRMWQSTNNSFWNLENRSSTVVFSFYNTNYGLGLDRETLLVYINGTRLINNYYYCANNTKINLTIKDYYNFTLYQNNFTISGAFTFIDLGLTFHSYLFGNKNNDYYMISLLKEGAVRWWERGIVPYGEREYLIPSGNYSLRIYDKNYDEIYNDTASGGDTINNSKVYVIHGINLTEIISGQSVIRGQLLELNSDLDYALMPDEQIYAYNPCTIFSVFDRLGMMLGQDIWEVCPLLNIIAVTENSSYSCSIDSYPLIPSNGTTANGTISIVEDIIYISGNSSVNYVNITYKNNGTLMQNTTYIPGKINLNGQNLTITSNCNIYILRETTYSQSKKFYWNIYNSTINPGHISGRAGYHSAGITVSNPLGVNIKPVYVYAGFSDKTIPDLNSVQIYDVENGVNLERGEHFKVTDGLEFQIEGGIPAGTDREFTMGYYKDTAHTYYYEDAQIEIMQYSDEKTLAGYSGVYKYAEFLWINDKPLAFRGSLRVKLGFDIDLDTDSIKVMDLNNNQVINDRDIIVGDEFILISNNVMGTVQSGGTRSFGIYFQELQYPGQNLNDIHLNTPLVILAGLPISMFLIIVIIGVVLVLYGIYSYIRERGRKEKYIYILLLGFALILFTWILQAKGL